MRVLVLPVILAISISFIGTLAHAQTRSKAPLVRTFPAKKQKPPVQKIPLKKVVVAPKPVLKKPAPAAVARKPAPVARPVARAAARPPAVEYEEKVDKAPAAATRPTYYSIPSRKWNVEDVLNRYKGMIVRIFTSLDSSSQRSHIMSGFAVGPNQVATSTDILEGLLQSSPPQKIFIEWEGRVSEASIMVLDASRRVAVLKTEPTFPAYVDRNDFRMETVGPSFYVGFSPAAQIIAQPGISYPTLVGGPMLDSEGKVLGLTQPEASNLRSSAYIIGGLMAQASKLPASLPNWKKQLMAQLGTHQEQAMASLYDNVKVRISNWHFGSWAKTWTCEKTPHEMTSAIGSVEHEACYSKSDIRLANRDFGKIELGAWVVKGSGEATPEKRSHLAEEVSRSMIKEFETENANQGQMTPVVCSQSKVKGDQGTPLYVHYCTAGWKHLYGYNNTLIRFVTLNKGQETAVATLHLRGLDLKNTTKAYQLVAQEIRRSGGAD